MNRLHGVVAALALAAIVGVSTYAVTTGVVGGTPTANIVKDTYKLATGSDVEVMKVEEDGVLDKVTLRQGNNVFDAFVTSDGKYLVQQALPIDEYTGLLESRDDFLTCLTEQGAQFYGILGSDNQQLAQHTRMAQAQIQVLGGTNGLQDVFRGPGTEDFPQQQVVNNGVVWRLNGELSPGIKTIQQLESATGCTYDQSGQ